MRKARKRLDLRLLNLAYAPFFGLATLGLSTTLVVHFAAYFGINVIALSPAIAIGAPVLMMLLFMVTAIEFWILQIQHYGPISMIPIANLVVARTIAKEKGVRWMPAVSVPRWAGWVILSVYVYAILNCGISVAFLDSSDATRNVGAVRVATGGEMIFYNFLFNWFAVRLFEVPVKGATREENEHRFDHWEDLPAGGRRYWLDNPSPVRWFTRIVKTVDANERMVGFTEESYNGKGRLVRVRQIYPVHTGYEQITSGQESERQ